MKRPIDVFNDDELLTKPPIKSQELKAERLLRKRMVLYVDANVRKDSQLASGVQAVSNFRIC